MRFQLRRFATVGSTMDIARSLIAREAESGLIVTADAQIAGRGRIEGRSWEAGPGTSLLMTLCLKGDFSAVEAPSLRIGLAVRDVLSGFTPSRILIKWPNDIMGLSVIEDEARPRFRKLGGLLCETTGGWLLAGIGINLRKESYPEALKEKATSLDEVACLMQAKQEPPGSPNPDKMPETDWLALAIAEAAVSRLEDKDWREDYEEALWGIGERIGFRVGHPERGDEKKGIIRGIDSSGRLLLLGENGEAEAFWSGEISSLKSV
ncbi:MAG: biotin--[acetyl-CoA-carboxylase] ligase [Candidatus Hydrogenedentales bacterium]